MPSLLDAAPPLPDSVKGQMGPPDAGGFAQAGKMLEKGAGPANPANAQGALRAQADAVKKVIQKMADSAAVGKTFFSRALQLIEQGMAAEATKGPGSPANPQPDLMGNPNESGGNQMPAAFPG